VPAYLKKLKEAKWVTVGDVWDIPDDALPGLKEVKRAQASINFGTPEVKGMGCVYEKWKPVSFNWHYECDEIFYVVEGGPIKVFHQEEELRGNAGDVFLFTRGTDVRFEIVNELIGLTVTFPSFEEIIERYRDYAEKLQTKKKRGKG
jgi:uncharacterized cupin superfamily protein